MGAQDRLHQREVVAVLGVAVGVEGQVERVPAARGRQRDVVGGRDPDLHREADPQVGRVQRATALAEHVEAGLARHGVLHLAEDDAARGGEDPVRDVGVGPRAEQGGAHPVHPRDHGRHPVGAGSEHAERGVLQELVVEPGTPPGERAAHRQVGAAAGVALGQHPVGVREPVHVDVVGGRGHLVEAVERLVPRHRLLLRLQHEDRLDPERDRGEDAERAEPDPGEVEDVGVLLGRGAEQLAGPGHQLEAHHLRGQPGSKAAGAMGAGRDGAGQGLVGDVAHVVQREPERLEDGVELLQGGAGARGHTHRLAVDRDDAGQPAGPEHGRLGRRDRGEAVAGPDHLDAAAGLHRAAYLREHLLGVGRRDLTRRVCRLQTRPVRPGRHGRSLLSGPDASRWRPGRRPAPSRSGRGTPPRRRCGRPRPRRWRLRGEPGGHRGVDEGDALGESTGRHGLLDERHGADQGRSDRKAGEEQQRAHGDVAADQWRGRHQHGQRDHTQAHPDRWLGPPPDCSGDHPRQQRAERPERQEDAGHRLVARRLGERHGHHLSAAEQPAQRQGDQPDRDQQPPRHRDPDAVLGPRGLHRWFGAAQGGEDGGADQPGDDRGHQSSGRVDGGGEDRRERRPGEEDALVDHRLEGERGLPLRGVVEDVGPARADGGADGRHGGARDRGEDVGEPHPVPRLDRPDQSGEAEGADEDGRHQHPGLAEPVDHPALEDPGQARRGDECRRDAARQAVGVRAGRDQQHDAEGHHRDRQPGQEAARRERDRAGLREDLTVGGQHGHDALRLGPRADRSQLDK